MKIQKMVSLDQETAEIASSIGIQYRAHGGFSTWLRNQLRSYRNKSENDDAILAKKARQVQELTKMSTHQLLWQLEQRSEEEIKALVNLLKGTF